MPKFPTFPTLYDEVLTITISKLKEWGYLDSGQCQRYTLTWSKRGNQTGQIAIIVNTLSHNPYMELDYNYKDKPVNYKVYFITKSSNLGKGVLWYFVCPYTGKYCRKLYSIGGTFLHRQAFKGCMYEKQTNSHKYRQIFKTLDKNIQLDKYYEQLYSKHFKSHYAGKPTKKYLRLMELIKQGESLSYQEIERLMMK